MDDSPAPVVRVPNSYLHPLVVHQLAPDEVINGVFACPPNNGTGEQLLVVTNANVRFVDDRERHFAYPLETLIGFRTETGVVRLGFRLADGAVARITAHIGGGLRERRELHANLARAWIRRTRQPFPAADLENCPESRDTSAS